MTASSLLAVGVVVLLGTGCGGGGGGGSSGGEGPTCAAYGDALDLVDVTIWSGEINLPLSPPFSPVGGYVPPPFSPDGCYTGVFEIRVPTLSSPLQVVPTSRYGDAQIVVNGEKVPSGRPSPPIVLRRLEPYLHIQVTAPSVPGQTRLYTVYAGVSSSSAGGG